MLGFLCLGPLRSSLSPPTPQYAAKCMATPEGVASFRRLTGGAEITDDEWDATYLYLVFVFVKT